jgi:2,3,4,5-tetrahydropyridine-2-carboxylate N-succinyltransferase
MMPSYINIGAYVDEGTMVDTWATVGSCAQIGKNVHLSGGVGVGGVLEPVQASPVIIEDGAFVGSRCILVEGVRIGKEAVLGANVVLTASAKIIDVTGPKPVEMKGFVPERSVVIPGSYAKDFPAGSFHVLTHLIANQPGGATNWYAQTYELFGSGGTSQTQAYALCLSIESGGPITTAKAGRASKASTATR